MKRRGFALVSRRYLPLLEAAGVEHELVDTVLFAGRFRREEYWEQRLWVPELFARVLQATSLKYFVREELVFLLGKDKRKQGLLQLQVELDGGKLIRALCSFADTHGIKPEWKNRSRRPWGIQSDGRGQHGDVDDLS
jgi:hypothetical protein